MKWYGYVALVAMLAAVVMVAGCRNPLLKKGGGSQDALQVIGGNPEMLYHGVGIALIVAGVGTIAFGCRAVGGAMAACGVGIAVFGKAIMGYPWISMVAVVVTGVCAVFIAYDRFKRQKVLEVTTEAIQNAPEGRAVKDGISAMGMNVEDAVRSVVTPIKDKLKLAGKIQ